jgi:pimeloyl-ACP methyl ester carboxylesterase
MANDQSTDRSDDPPTEGGVAERSAPAGVAELDALAPHRRSIETPSGPVSYLDVGDDPDAGPVTLFVHGVGTNAYFWRHLITSLRPERRCIAIDLPLHGHSPAAADQDLSLAALGQLVEDVCAALDLTAIDLVAHDTGGAVAQIFAARHPERLRSFCLTNCDTHDNVPPEAFKPTVELAEAGAIAPGAADLLADLVSARAVVFEMGYEDVERLDLGVVREFLEPLLGSLDRAQTFERLLVGLRPDDLLAVEPDLARLNVPTLVVWGTGDTFFELKWAYWLRDTIPGVTEVVELDGARLFFPDERADELLPHLRRHWAAVAV